MAVSGSRRFTFLIAVAAVIWYGCVVIFWALQPLSDAVPVGVDYTLKPPVFVSVAVDCNGLFQRASRGATPLPALKAQPVGSPRLGFQREPCVIVHHQARMVFALDTAGVLAVLALAGWVVYWRPKSAARQELVADHPVGLSVS